MNEENKNEESTLTPPPVPAGLFFDDSEGPEPVTIKHKDGTVGEYLIVEMEPDDFASWLKFQSTRAKRDGKGRVDPHSLNLENTYETYLHYSMRTKDGKRIPISNIKKWGQKTKSGLMVQCQKKNGEDGEVDDSGKK